MDKKASGNQLTIDVAVRYRGRIYNLTLGRIFRWLFPVALVVYRWLRQVHDQAS